MPTARAGYPPSTRPINEYKVLLELKPEYQADPQGALAALLQEHQRQADSARHAGEHQPGDRTADHQPLRPASGGDHLLQPEARRFARAMRSTQVQEVADRTLPATISTTIPGRRQGVPELAGQSVGAADHRHHGGVHRARHSVRELHPPASRFSPACRRRASARC